MNYMKDPKFKGNILLATYIVVLSYVFLNLDQIGNLFGTTIDIIKPFLIAICIAFVLNLPMKFYENKFLPLLFKNIKSEKIKSAKRPIAIVLTLVTIIGLIIGLVIFVIPQLIESGATLAKNIPGYIESLENMIPEEFGATEVANKLVTEITNMGQDVLKVVGQVTGSFVSQVVEITVGVTSTIFNFFMGILIAVYILMSKEKLCLQIKKVLYAFMPKEKAEKIMTISKLSNLKFSRFVAGQCIEACILGFLCFIGMNIFSMPYALLISMIVGVTALIPIFGAFIGTIPGAFILFMVDPKLALYFIILIVVIQQIEGNLIYPFVVGNSIGLSALWMLFAISVGGSTFGIMGILIGIPLFGVIYTLMGITTNSRLKNKNIIVDEDGVREIVIEDNEEESNSEQE